MANLRVHTSPHGLELDLTSLEGHSDSWLLATFCLSGYNHVECWKM